MSTNQELISTNNHQVDELAAEEEGVELDANQRVLDEDFHEDDLEHPPQVDSRNFGAASGTATPLTFQDHFSLKSPSSSIRFRGSNVHVCEGPTSQWLLEDKQDSVVTIRRVSHTSFTMRVFRSFYALISIFFAGFVLIFCLHVIIFLFFDMAAEVSGNDNIVALLGALFSLPLFVYGLSSTMTMAVHFVGDVWGGHSFLRNMCRWDVVWTEWIAFFVFLGAPVLTMCITLFARTENWWEVTLLTWFSFIFGFWGYYAAAVLYYEMTGCILLMQQLDPELSKFDLLRRAILLREIHNLSAAETRTYLMSDSSGAQLPVVGFEDHAMMLYSRCVMFLISHCCSRGRLFRKLDPPRRIYSTEEALGVEPILTAKSWSLERLYCQPRSARTVTLIQGKSALTPRQLKSSLACTIIGSLLGALTLIALLVWLEMNAGAIVLLAVICSLCCLLPSIRSTFRARSLYRKMTAQAGDVDRQEQSWGEDGEETGGKLMDDRNESTGMYQVSERYRLTEPTKTFCWFVFSTEMLLCFLFPLVALAATGNWPVALLFLLIGVFSIGRYFFSCSVAVIELGSIESLGNNDSGDGGDEQWKAKARLSEIIQNISWGRALNLWMTIFSITVLMFFVLALGAINTDSVEGIERVQKMTLLPDFVYDPQPDLPYPTCEMRKGLGLSDDLDSASLSDFVFLSSMAYTEGNRTQELLDGWFGENNATNEEEIVKRFTEEYNGGNVSPVSFNMITFTQIPGYAVVTIKGSTNPWDWFVNAQLWGAAALVQGLRFIMPIGQMWTPILSTIIKMISVIQSTNLEDVAYYKYTSEFLRALQSSGEYNDLVVTGQSLGGGLSIISGAQTGVPAVAVSGPNALLSREIFSPPLTVDALNTKVFNLVPDRDVVPMVDDLARLYQKIDCRADKSDIFGCHDVLRSLCEVMYSCGTQGRPPICRCAKHLGYPEPRPTGTRSFDEACANSFDD